MSNYPIGPADSTKVVPRLTERFLVEVDVVVSFELCLGAIG